MTYDTFKDKAISSKVTLAELSLKKECLTWTVHSGACYKCTFNDTLSNAPIDISSIEEDGTALTESTDLADCIASAGEWYQDISAGLLYVHCTAGADPNTKVLISIFKVYFSTEGKVFNSIYYLPCIPTDGISLDCSSDYVDSGNLTLLNGDALFDTKLEDWIWRGCSCTVKMGGDSLTYAQYETMGDFLIQAIDFTNQNIVLNLKGVKMNWNRQLPINEFYTEETTIRPNADTATTTWEDYPSAGDDYTKVNEAISNKDTNYIYTTEGGSPESLFEFENVDLPAGATVNFIELHIVGRKVLDQDGRIMHLIKSGATPDYKDSVRNRWDYSRYSDYAYTWSTDPDTGVTWLEAGVNAILGGVRGDIKAAGQGLRVTQIYIVVNYSVMRTFDEGKCLPILIGELPVAEDATFTPVLIDNTIQKGKFGLADKSVQRIKSVDTVKYEGNTLTAGAGNDYIADLTNCILTILDTSAYTVDDPSALKVNLKGARIDDITGEASTEHITSASNILRHLFDRVLEWDNAKIDDSSFDTAATSAPQECRLFITDRMYVADIIALICQSVKGILSQNRDGVLYFNIWSESDAGALTLQDEDILEFKINERRIMPAYRVIVKYGRDPDSGDWKLETAKDDSVKYKYEQVETKTFETLLVNKNDARDLAFEFLDAYKNPIKEIEILVKLQASKLRVGDKIKITRTRAPDSAGSWTAETFQVKTVTKEGRYKTRLILEPNMYLSAIPISTDEKMKYDDKEAISRAVNTLTSDFEFKADKKVEGKTPTIGTTTDKTEGAIENTTYLIKTDKVIATSIKLDEALRKDSISTISIGADEAKAVEIGQAYPVNYIVSMYSSGGGVAYDLASFNNLGVLGFGEGTWYIVTFVAGTGLPHGGTDGDMETAGVAAWTTLNGATLSKIASPVHGGIQALKIEIAGGQTWGGAEQEVAIPLATPFERQCVKDFTGWLRNGNATNVQMSAWYYWTDTNWYQINSTITKTQTDEYQEAYLLRQSINRLVTKVKIKFVVNGAATNYGYVDDVFVRAAEKSVHIKQASGASKDFKIRAFIEQAGT